MGIRASGARKVPATNSAILCSIAIRYFLAAMITETLNNITHISMK